MNYLEMSEMPVDGEPEAAERRDEFLRYEFRRQPEPQPATTRQRSLLLLVAAVVLVLDQLSKYLIEAALPIYHSWAPIPSIASFFQITHVTNTGAAFGLFPAGSLLFTLAAVIVSVVIIFYNYRLPAGNMALRLALGLQLGGAIGNLIDRMRLGHVTDFLDFGPWPVFNLADTAVVAGVLVLGWLMLNEQKGEPVKVAGEEVRTAGPHAAERSDEWPAD